MCAHMPVSTDSISIIANCSEQSVNNSWYAGFVLSLFNPFVYPPGVSKVSRSPQAHSFVINMALNTNMNPAPVIWPGEEQPSLLDQDASLLSPAPIIAVTVTSPPEMEEQEIHSTTTSFGPCLSQATAGELVIVINEKMENSKT